MKLPVRFALLLLLTVLMTTVVLKGPFGLFDMVNTELPHYAFEREAIKQQMLYRFKKLWKPEIQIVTECCAESQPASKTPAPWDVTKSHCLANESVASASWFQGLEHQFQHYVLYRHCREFPMILNHPEKCEGNIHLLIIIKSIITQHDRRELIRKTWGKEQEVRGKKVRTLFLLGTASKDQELVNHQKLLEYEDKIFGDILQWDFLDSFYNLTLKETHFLKWFSKYCQQVQYVFKGDDDVFVNIPNILEYLKESHSKNLFTGDVMYSARPIRKKRNKYYIPKQLYNKSFYPPYAGGGGFVMGGLVTKKLYEASKLVELFPIDDVFLGMCLEQLDIKPIKHNAFKTFGLVKDKSSRLNREPCFFKSMIVVHKLLPPDLIKMWRKVNSNLVCTKTFNFTEA